MAVVFEEMANEYISLFNSFLSFIIDLFDFVLFFIFSFRHFIKFFNRSSTVTPWGPIEHVVPSDVISYRAMSLRDFNCLICNRNTTGLVFATAITSSSVLVNISSFYNFLCEDPSSRKTR